MPVFGVVLIALSLLIGDRFKPTIGGFSTHSVYRAVPTLLLVAALLVYPFHSMHAAENQFEENPVADRAIMGQALGDLADRDSRMLGSQAGAIPYYSQ